MKKLSILLGLIWGISGLFAQQLPTQILKGKVTDIDSKQPLAGVLVYLADTVSGIGTITDENGDFRLENVPIKRQSLICQLMGYETYRSGDLILTAGKELELNIGMKENITNTTASVIITSKSVGSQPVNDFATVSTRSFSTEQVQRFPGTINDPGRMATAFPGVQMSRDNNNDIIIRGNSPTGLLWRLEGIDIANPNHFARRGSSGGGITVFSLSLMANSDFSTGAFAPEYGNAFAGVFDMNFRKGNMEKREYTFRAGLIGLDAATEGYFKKGRSSYLVNYRYSTLGILNKMGVHLVGPRTNNTFQDLSFNLTFKTGKTGTFTVFGIGGISSELTSIDKDTLAQDSLLENRLKTDFITHTGNIGATYTQLLDEKSYIKAVAVVGASKVINYDDTLNLDTRTDFFRTNTESYLNGHYAASFLYNRKFSSRFTMKTGIQLSNLIFNNFQSRYFPVTQQTDTLITGKGSAFLVQPYWQGSYRATEKITFIGGLRAVYMGLNQTTSLEPRLAMRYQILPKTAVSLAYGLHGQTVPLGSYFTEINQQLVNKNLKLIKAHHFVMGINQWLTNLTQLRVEMYYQHLYHLPVAKDINSTYSPLNDRDGYAKTALVSEGLGRNYGIDVSVDKYFQHNFFLLLGGSLYRSQYQPLNGKWYDTRYNGKFNLSLMGGKEFAIGKKSVLEVGGRGVYSGGLRYSPVDSVATLIAGQLISKEDAPFSLKVPNYMRIDVRVACRWNGQKVAHILALDVQNLTNRVNYSTLIYQAGAQSPFVLRKQATLTPVISYIIDF